MLLSQELSIQLHHWARLLGQCHLYRLELLQLIKIGTSAGAQRAGELMHCVKQHRTEGHEVGLCSDARRQAEVIGQVKEWKIGDGT